MMLKTPSLLENYMKKYIWAYLWDLKISLEEVKMPSLANLRINSPAWRNSAHLRNSGLA